jgi:hypothetical protein
VTDVDLWPLRRRVALANPRSVLASTPELGRELVASLGEADACVLRRPTRRGCRISAAS